MRGIDARLRRLEARAAAALDDACTLLVWPAYAGDAVTAPTLRYLHGYAGCDGHCGRGVIHQADKLLPGEHPGTFRDDDTDDDRPGPRVVAIEETTDGPT